MCQLCKSLLNAQVPLWLRHEPTSAHCRFVLVASPQAWLFPCQWPFRARRCACLAHLGPRPVEIDGIARRLARPWLWPCWIVPLSHWVAWSGLSWRRAFCLCWPRCCHPNTVDWWWWYHTAAIARTWYGLDEPLDWCCSKAGRCSCPRDCRKAKTKRWKFGPIHRAFEIIVPHCGHTRRKTGYRKLVWSHRNPKRSAPNSRWRWPWIGLSGRHGQLGWRHQICWSEINFRQSATLPRQSTF